MANASSKCAVVSSVVKFLKRIEFLLLLRPLHELMVITEMLDKRFGSYV